MSDLPDIDDDFAPIPLEVQVARRLARHESHETISEAIGLPVEQVHELAASAVATWQERRATRAEEFAVLHWAIDDTLTRVVGMIDSDPGRHDAAALLALRLEALRLRSALIRMERCLR